VAVHYRISESDYIAAQRELIGRRLRSRAVLLALAILLIAGGMLALDRPITAVTFLVAIAFVIALMFVLLPRAWRRAYRAIPPEQREQSVEFSADGLVYDSAHAHATVRWAAYSHYVETDRLILLHQPSRVIVPLPKSAFPPDELRRLRELVAERLPRDRPARARSASAAPR
jgi:hypothetical protein